MNWDNAADVALLLGLYSAIRLCVYFAARSNGVQMRFEPYSTVASVVLAALFFTVAYALHAPHAAYYIALGWYAEVFLQPAFARSKYVWTIAFAAYGVACIMLLGNFWFVLGAWTAGMVAIAALSIRFTNRRPIQ